jgi:hypothetical protein
VRIRRLLRGLGDGSGCITTLLHQTRSPQGHSPGALSCLILGLCGLTWFLGASLACAGISEAATFEVQVNPATPAGPWRSKRDRATFRLDWKINTKTRRALEAEQFGKRILFTDHDHWNHARVVAAYRSQSEVEADFRQMKDPHIVSFSPMFHWTDQKIRVHAFYCVLALTIARLMHRQTANAGHPISVRELLATLAGIQETVLLYPSTGGRPRARRMTTEMTTTQAHLYDLFNLHTYAPTQTRKTPLR